MYFPSVNTDNLPWIEKYRPQHMKDIISHKYIVQSMHSFMESKMMPHLLFFGPSGTGKTSLIKCMAKQLYGDYDQYMTKILNASIDRGIETVRNTIKSFINHQSDIFAPLEYRNVFRLIILDEIDSMTAEAQGMLRQIIEKRSSSVRFCLICNDVDRIDAALQSRCAAFCFSVLPSSVIHNYLLNICQKEHIKISDTAVQAIVKISNGDMRSAINMLQQLYHFTQDEMTEKYVYALSGFCPMEIIQNIMQLFDQLYQNHITLHDCIDQLYEYSQIYHIVMSKLLNELSYLIMNNTLYDDAAKIYIIDQFAQCEVYTTIDFDQRILLMTMASIFEFLKK